MKKPSPRKVCIVSAVATVFGFGWTATVTWGVPDVTQTLLASASKLNTSAGDLQRLDVDPDIAPQKRIPWYFVGNASAPLPFLIAIDSAYRVGPTAGQRSRYYVFWFFGIKVLIHERLVWMS